MADFGRADRGRLSSLTVSNLIRFKILPAQEDK